MFRIPMRMLLAAWICCAGVGMADTVLVSDDFNNGAVNSHAALDNRTLNNGLGGMIPNVKWYAPQAESVLVINPNFDSVAMEAHEDRVEMGTLGLQNNQAYRLDALVRNISWWNTIIVEANHGSLWQPGGLLVTVTPSTLGGLYWLNGGSAFDNQIATVGLSPADYDADGNVPLSIIYSHENRAIKSALSLWVLANGNTKISAKVNLDPSGELIGFGGAQGVFAVDNVKVSLTTLPTPEPTPPSLANSEPMRNETMSNVKDYTFGWWMYGWRDSRKVFAFQSNKYALAFDYPSFDLQSLFPIKQPLAEQEAASQANDTVFSDAANRATDIECVLESGSNRYKVTSASPDASNCYLSETGKYFQRRILHQLNWASGAPGRGCDDGGGGLAGSRSFPAIRIPESESRLERD